MAKPAGSCRPGRFEHGAQNMKLAVIYHSQSGNTKRIAEIVAAGAKISDVVEVKVMDINCIDEEYVANAKAIIFGCPTYCGSLSWQMKRWFDMTSVGLEGKLGSTFATENYLGGGADVAELGMIGCLLIRGMLVYTAGFTKEGPITHYGAVTIKAGDDWQQQRASLLGKRVAEKALELFGDKSLA
jgi:NAD(P)H dehydrogenase (quinone)